MRSPEYRDFVVSLLKKCSEIAITRKTGPLGHSVRLGEVHMKVGARNRIIGEVQSSISICVVAVGNTGSSKMVSDWSSSQAPTYSHRIAAKE